MTEQNQGPESWSDEQKWTYLVRHERIGELLVRQGKLTLGQLETALLTQEQQQPPQHLGEIIVEKGFLSLDEIVTALENQRSLNSTSKQTIEQLKTKNKE